MLARFNCVSCVSVEKEAGRVPLMWLPPFSSSELKPVSKLHSGGKLPVSALPLRSIETRLVTKPN